MFFISIKGSKGYADVNSSNINFITFPEALRHVKNAVLGPAGETHHKETFYIIQLHMNGGSFSLPAEFPTEAEAREHWDKVKEQMKAVTIDA